MLETIVRQQIIFYAMGILVAVGIVSKAIAYLTVRKMARAASEIQKSNHKLMRLVKGKFEHASMVSDKVENVGAFVQKYLYEYTVLGVRLNSLRSWAKKLVWVVAFLGVLGGFESYRIQGIGNLTLQYLQWTILFVLALIFVSMIWDESARLEAAKNYMVEYLENVCAHRYAKTGRASEVVEAETLEEDKQEEEQESEEAKRKAEQEMRIRAILEEFLA